MNLVDEVSDLLRHLGAEVVMPRFGALEVGDVRQKGPDDPVTIVDQEVESQLELHLPRLVRGSRVVGEEGASADPRILSGLGQGWVWVVDPLDGTINFVEGRPDFAVMVGLMREGEPVVGWIYSPPSGRLCTAEAGAGAYLDGKRLTRPDPGSAAPPQGLVSTRHLPPEVRARWDESAHAFDLGDGAGSAGIDYPALAEGRWGFLVYWQTMPWDHVPGTLAVLEAGGSAARLDGTAYRPGDGRTGLLSCSGNVSWDEVRSRLPI